MRDPPSVEATHHLKLTFLVPLTLHPAAVYLSGLSEGSRPTMRHALDAIAYLLTDGECDAMNLDWAALRYQHTAAVRAALMPRLAPATCEKMLCALRRVLKEARKLKLIEAEDYEAAIDLPRIDTPPRKLRGRALKGDEIAALFEACQKEDARTIDVRDAALIAILRGGGLRRNEVVNLELKDFDSSTGAIEVHKAKRGAYRKVYLPTGACAIVEQWLAIRGNAPGALLCPIHRWGQVALRPMTSDAVLRILKRRAQEAGVDSFSAHDFRRTFCSDLLDAGVDIVTVQKLAGHTSPTVTAKYDRRGEEAKRRAVQNLEIPSKRLD